MRTSLACLCGAVFATGVLGSMADGAGAQELTLKGKTVSLIINSAAGGGTDTAARVTGAALAKQLPGSPSMNFRNLPGGGGLKANNYFAAQVPPDGLTLLSGARNQISPIMLLGGQAKYDPSKYEFVGGDASLGTLLLIRKEALPQLNDPSMKPVVYGDIDGLRSGVVISLWAKEFLDWNMRWVVGYSGTSAMLMSLQSGELDMAANQNAFHVVPLLKSGKFVGLAQLGILNAQGKRVGRAAFGDTPLLEDLIEPKLNDEQRAAFRSMQSDFAVNKWLALPPGTPKPYVDMYRAAYDKAVVDESFLAVITKELGEDYAPLTGQQMKMIVDELVATTAEDLAYVSTLRKKYNLPGE